MESELEHTFIDSNYFDTKKFKKQIDIIKHASEIAQSKIDYSSAHNDNILRAIEVVEEFLKTKHRLCYGGQAINAHLPSKYKFYDSEKSIPDYDFFTPNQHKDINTLTKELRNAGFSDISVREGMHEGTIKVYVDYIPIADMTVIDAKLYKILSKREFRLDGISYLDANTLRMLMYLELSRPRGEVSRWTKVYERLALFNEFVPVKSCTVKDKLFRNTLNKEQVSYTLNYIINNKRIFAGADLLDFYSHALKFGKKNTEWILTSKKPIIFYSSESDVDSKNLKNEFNYILNQANKSAIQNDPDNSKTSHISIKTYSSKGIDIIPSLKVITYKNKPLVIIIDQNACHSYFNVPIEDSKIMRIASMDTLITLYFSLGLFNNTFYDMGSMECLANKIVEISMKARNKLDDFAFPFISVKCAGHQPSLPSLIRSKVRRITQKKQELRKIMANKQPNRSIISRKTVKQMT